MCFILYFMRHFTFSLTKSSEKKGFCNIVWILCDTLILQVLCIKVRIQIWWSSWEDYTTSPHYQACSQKTRENTRKGDIKTKPIWNTIIQRIKAQDFSPRLIHFERQPTYVKTGTRGTPGGGGSADLWAPPWLSGPHPDSKGGALLPTYSPEYKYDPWVPGLGIQFII